MVSLAIPGSSRRRNNRWFLRHRCAAWAFAETRPPLRHPQGCNAHQNLSFRIRVATYNVHKCKGLDRRTDPERIASLITALNADVVAIQEILDVRDGRPEYDQARCITAEVG
ncbi:MAG TPA: hypothetical protein VFB28_05765 [Terriglobales bacterium]|nr:hypothetical protein [Terriglobales bacterium]